MNYAAILIIIKLEKQTGKDKSHIYKRTFQITFKPQLCTSKLITSFKTYLRNGDSQ